MYHNSLYLFILFCLSLTTTASLVPAVCKYISNADREDISYKFCVSTLGSDPRSNKSTVAQLAEISLQLSIAKAKDVSLTIEELLKQSVSDVLRRSALTNCLNLYSTVPDNLDEGLKALKSEDYHQVTEVVSAAMDKATNCGDGIKEKEGAMSPVKENNDGFHHLGVLSLAFTNLLPIVN